MTDQFFTLDVYKAAFLVMCGLTYTTSYRKGKVSFLFGDVNKAHEHIRTFQTTRVLAGDYAEHIKSLRKELYLKRQEAEGNNNGRKPIRKET